MKVKSKLADVDFRFGAVQRKDNMLVISSDPAQTMQSKVYVTPDDVVQFLGKLLTSPSGLLFVFGFPVFYFRARGQRKAAAESTRKSSPRNPW
jgi:hypothetical protein